MTQLVHRHLIRENAYFGVCFTGYTVGFCLHELLNISFASTEARSNRPKTHEPSKILLWCSRRISFTNRRNACTQAPFLDYHCSRPDKFRKALNFQRRFFIQNRVRADSVMVDPVLAVRYYDLRFIFFFCWHGTRLSGVDIRTEQLAHDK